MEIPVREFKDNLSEYLCIAAEGEPIVITSHRKPVAILNPIPHTDKPGLQQVLTSGKVKWRGTRAVIDPRRPVAPIRGKSIVDTVLDDRK